MQIGDRVYSNVMRCYGHIVDIKGNEVRIEFSLGDRYWFYVWEIRL